MTLGELIIFLENENPEQKVEYGFGNPHSYRGYYQMLAFEPKRNVTIKEMLDEAKFALGNTYEGYKGGEFTMERYTDVYLANWGRSGEGISPILLCFMVGKNPDQYYD